MDGILQYRGIERLIIIAIAPLLIWIGYRLFVLGATGQMTLTAKSHTVTGKITNLSPSVFCFLAATVLSIFALSHGADVETKRTVVTEAPSTPAGGAAAAPGLPGAAAAKAGEATPVVSKAGPERRTEVTEEKKSSYETGRADSARLSDEIRRRLGDAGLCLLNHGKDPVCQNLIDRSFLRVPTEDDLRAIEELEAHADVAGNAGKLRALRKDYLKEAK